MSTPPPAAAGEEAVEFFEQQYPELPRFVQHGEHASGNPAEWLVNITTKARALPPSSLRRARWLESPRTSCGPPREAIVLAWVQLQDAQVQGLGWARQPMPARVKPCGMASSMLCLPQHPALAAQADLQGQAERRPCRKCLARARAHHMIGATKPLTPAQADLEGQADRFAATYAASELRRDNDIAALGPISAAGVRSARVRPS